MSPSPHPKPAHKRKFSAIWLVPILAAVISLWLGLEDILSRGPQIVVEFTDGTGLQPGKTVLEYKGVTVGVVKSVKLSEDLTEVMVQVALQKAAAPLAKTGSKFWIVHPEIGAGGVSGLDTLVSGVRLTVRPGGGTPAKRFKGLDKTPPPDVSDHGRTFILKTDQLGSLSSGSPVMYRQLKVGQVEASRLSDDATAVLVRIHIDDPYGDLVRTNTRFWNAGGFNLKLSLLGAQVKDSSLESLLSGGVAFATPDGPALAPAAAEGAQFDLAAEADKSWLKWAPKIPVKSQESFSPPPAKSSLLPQSLER